MDHKLDSDALSLPYNVEHLAPSLALSASPLSVLPVELIIDILSALDFRSLLCCKRVCRLFHGLVRDSAALQYYIQLAAAGMEDGPPNSVSTAERLDMLKQYMAAWDASTWTRDETIEMGSGHLWELYGGVLAQYDGDRKSIQFRQLPSDYRGIAGQVWSIEIPPEMHLRDFAMDPSQDLLVLIENPSWRSVEDEDRVYRIHLRNLRTGEAHPFARLAVITHEQETPDFLVKYTLQVSGDHIGILFHGHDCESQLFILEWKTGHVEINVFGDEIRSFAFLTDRHVVVGILSSLPIIGPYLLVMNFKDASFDGVPLEDTRGTEHVSLFSFPEFTSATIPLEITIRSDPAPNWTPNSNLQVPFFTARNNRLYVLTVWIQRDGRLVSIVLFVPSFTLISLLGDAHDHISWENWGPEGTRMMLSPGHSHIWVCYVFGTKFVVHKRLEQGSTIQVYDFNQLALQATRASEAIPSNDTIVYMEPSIVPNRGVFSNNVYTFLPFRLKTIPLQMEPGLAVMCSEDSLIIVQNNERQFRILSF